MQYHILGFYEDTEQAEVREVTADSAPKAARFALEEFGSDYVFLAAFDEAVDVLGTIQVLPGGDEVTVPASELRERTMTVVGFSATIDRPTSSRVEDVTHWIEAAHAVMNHYEELNLHYQLCVVLDGDPEWVLSLHDLRAAIADPILREAGGKALKGIGA